MRPARTERRPQIASRIVVLPSPVLPIRTAYWPPGTSNEMFDKQNKPERMVTLASSTICYSALRRPALGLPQNLALLAFQVRHHERHVGGRDPADTASLGQRHRAHAAELFAGFEPQMANSGVVKLLRNPLVGQALLPRDLLLLPRDIAFVLEVIGHLLRGFAGNRGQRGLVGYHVGPLSFGTTQELLE